MRIFGELSVGWSVKSLLWDRKSNFEKDGSLKRVSTIIGRCSPDTYNGSHVEKNVTCPDEAGAIAVSIWNTRLTEAKNLCNEFRQITILKSSDLCKWLLFEFSPRFFDPTSFEWKWETGKGKGKEKKTVNLYGMNDEFRLTWQPNGSQFTLNMQIPKKHRVFNLDKNIPIISPEGVLSQIGFDNNWITLGS